MAYLGLGNRCLSHQGEWSLSKLEVGFSEQSCHSNAWVPPELTLETLQVGSPVCGRNIASALIADSKYDIV